MKENNYIRRRIIIFSIIVIFGFSFAYFYLRKHNPSVLVSTNIEKKDSLVAVSLLTETFDFEGEGNGNNEKAASGKNSYKLAPAIEYGFGVNKTMKDIPNFQSLKTIEVDMKCWLKKRVDALYVLAIDDPKGKNIYWESKPIICAQYEVWQNLHLEYALKPEMINSDYSIKIYPWNKSKEEFYIDDISVRYAGTGSEIKASAPIQTSATNFFFDFEKTDGLTSIDCIKKTTAHSGKMACDLTGGKEYGPLVIKKISEVSTGPLKKISTSAWIYPLTDNPNAVLTASIANEKNESLFWEGKGTDNKPFPKNKWTKINLSCALPFEKLKPEDKIQVNVWNKGKTDLIVDDLEIVYGESNDRRGEASTIDANSIYEKHFVPQENKPPFKTIYFEKQEINNGNSTFITPDKVNPLADFSPNDEFLVGNFIADKNKLDEVICIKNGKAALFSYNPETSQFKKVWEGTSLDSLRNLKSIIKFSDNTYPGNYSDNGKKEFLRLNTDWRFDLKLSEEDKGDNTVLGSIDFKGYPNDYNPKYYEFVKIIAGRFINSKRTSIIVMMRNCTDFKGTHCNQFENVPYLPNSTQLYSLEK